jgi:hypothetical protein
MFNFLKRVFEFTVYVALSIALCVFTMSALEDHVSTRFIGTIFLPTVVLTLVIFGKPVVKFLTRFVSAMKFLINKINKKFGAFSFFPLLFLATTSFSAISLMLLDDRVVYILNGVVWILLFATSASRFYKIQRMKNDKNYRKKCELERKEPFYKRSDFLLTRIKMENVRLISAVIAIISALSFLWNGVLLGQWNIGIMAALSLTIFSFLFFISNKIISGKIAQEAVGWLVTALLLLHFIFRGIFYSDWSSGELVFSLFIFLLSFSAFVLRRF